MTALLAVDALAPVSLDELVSGADLQARVDRKYLLPEASLPHLLVGLPDTTRAATELVLFVVSFVIQRHVVFARLHQPSMSEDHQDLVTELRPVP